jgi:hypothetical protein
MEVGFKGILKIGFIGPIVDALAAQMDVAKDIPKNDQYAQSLYGYR